MKSSSIVAVLFLSLAACGGTDAAPTSGSSSGGGAPGAQPGETPPGQVEDASAPNTTDPPAAACAGSAPAARDVTVDVTVAGRKRTASVHFPSAYDGKKALAVVLNFHGRGSNPDQQNLLSAMTAKSDSAGFVSVHPAGIGNTWNAGLCCGQASTENVDDVGFVRALTEELEKKFCVDPKRFFATGISNGGFISNRLACELSDRIAAIAPVAGQLLSASCSPKRPVPVMHFHGTADTIVPYGGGLGMPAIEQSVKAWAGRNACSASPKQTFTKGDTTCVTYEQCKDNADVTLCTVQDGGHTWPGGFAIPGLGKTTSDIRATDAMWEFFQKHPMP